ncbi:MAG: molybdopterin molybdotransferase MoeA [Sarcina sp.]
MISLEDAQKLILENSKILGTEKINVLNSYNRVLGEDIFSPIDSPPFNRSPLDGYALKAENLSTDFNLNVFDVIDTIYAGEISNLTVNDFQAIKIMTGAKIPEGANTIVRQEATVALAESKVKININQEEFDNFIFQGEDFKKEALILRKGTLITSNEAMALASLGINVIEVYKKPKIGVLTSGNELLNPGEKIQDGKIYNSNKIFLKMKLLELGCEVEFFDNILDENESIKSTLQLAEESSDIIISTGGVSVGEKDLIKDVILSNGYNLLFWKVDIKPGSPMFAAVNTNKIIYIGLSGTPVAAATTFELTVQNLIAHILNCKKLELKEVFGVLEDVYSKTSPKRRFLRVFYDKFNGNKVYINKAYQSPGQINTMLNSNAILEIPKNVSINKGDIVKIYMRGN